MATHSSIRAWRIPRTEEHGGLQSIGSQKVGGAWQATVHRVTKSRTRLSELHFYFLAPSRYGLRPSVTTPQKPPHTPREEAAFLSKLLWWTTFVPIELFCSVCYLKIGKNNNRNWARQNLKYGRIELHCTGGEGLLQAVAG